MFAKTIVLSDAFLDLPHSARCLYFALGMLADDDGFLNSAKSIMRQCDATIDDLNILIQRKFIIPFESGVIAIKHWRIHNTMRTDRYKATKYKDEFSLLETDENGSYRTIDNHLETVGIPLGNQTETIGIPLVGSAVPQVKLSKDKLNNNSIVDTTTQKEPKKPPTIDDVRAYCAERGNRVDAERFVDFYTANGWKVGKNPMKDWKAAVRNWERSESKGLRTTTAYNFTGERKTDYDALLRGVQ